MEEYLDSITKAIKRFAKYPIIVSGMVASRVCATNYKRVVISSNRAMGYLCNPKYIVEFLEKLYPGKFEFILLAKRKKDDVPAYVRQVHPRSPAAIVALATARFWIDNCRYPKLVPKRGDQIYIQTWHAYTSMAKRVEADAGDSLSQAYQDNARYDASITDLMFADNDHEESIYRNSFWYSGPILRCSTPRNEPLLHPSNSIVDRVRSSLGVPSDAGLCLYAPTFRKDYSQDWYRFDYEACLEALETRFGKRFVFAYRLHPNMVNERVATFLEPYIDASSYVDAQELVAAADVLISDYSSILEDYALTGRPGFVYAPDMDDYAKDRGSYFPLSKRPYPIARSSTELIERILSYDEELAARKRGEFFELIGYSAGGKGPEYIAEVIDRLSKPGTTVGMVL